jgi:acetyl esterase/lipase
LDLRGAIASAKAAARDAQASGRRVYAYGDSAGGTLAALLAEDDLVDAAVGYSPVANMRRFAAHNDDPALYEQMIGADRKLLLSASPGLHDSDRPILVLSAEGDEPSFRGAIAKWAARDPQVHPRDVGGPHAGGEQPGIYGRHAGAAISWLRRMP